MSDLKSKVAEATTRAKAHDRDVASALRRIGVPYRSDVATEGLWFDFVIDLGRNQLAVVEAKASWSGTNLPKRTNEFVYRAAAMERQSGLPVLTVLPDPPRAGRRSLPPGLVYLSDLATAIDSLRGSTTTSGKSRIALPPAGSRGREIFVAMPFDSEFVDVFEVAVRGAARALRGVHLGVYRVDYASEWGDIVAAIKAHIDSATFVVVDVSRAKPNVMLEYGYAVAKGKDVVLITSEPRASAPFDLNHQRMVRYDLHHTNELRTRLMREFRTLLRAKGVLAPLRRRPVS